MLPALLQAAIESARAEIDGLHAAAEGEAALGYRHSLHVIRTFTDVRQALRQLDGHANFASLPAKAAAYRDAFNILTRHTGEIPRETKPRHDAEEIPCLF